jgi:hypothetical protein
MLSLENNYLLNPAHPDMNKVVIGTAVPIDVDILARLAGGGDYEGPSEKTHG